MENYSYLFDIFPVLTDIDIVVAVHKKTGFTRVRPIDLPSIVQNIEERRLTKHNCLKMTSRDGNTSL